VTVNYLDKQSLVKSLRGTDVLLSFIIAHTDEGNVVQKNLIHACIEAGVKRFAPSEWGMYVILSSAPPIIDQSPYSPSNSANDSGFTMYKAKDEVAAYLADLNKDKTVLEYCLFQPSCYMDYYAHPHSLATHLITWPFFIDYPNRRAIVLDSGDQPIVLTAIRDVAAVVARALDYPGPWPPVGGIRGCATTINELVRLGESIRGGPFAVERVRGEDVERGVLRTSWVPLFSHPAIAREEQVRFSKSFVEMFLVAIKRGAWDVGGQWNELLPELRFMGVEEYMREAWRGREGDDRLTIFQT
jgi:hypothetical protein